MTAPPAVRVFRVSRASRLGTDRWIVLGLLVLVVLYAREALTFRAGVFVDPVGPRAFPLLLAGVLALSITFLFVRPTDHRPRWPAIPVQRRAGVLCVSLIAYGYLIQPLGYLASTTLVMTVLSLLFGGNVVKSTTAALALVAALYVLFSILLGLYLPALPIL